MFSIGLTHRTFGKNDVHPVHVFRDSDLALSLHSVADFVNNNENTCTLTKYGFRVNKRDGSLLCESSKHPDARLWCMPPIVQPISNSTPAIPASNSSLTSGSACLIVKNELDAEFVHYSSACFGNPPDQTLYRACVKGWLSNYPRLTPKMIHQNRPNSIETQLGHLSKLRQNIRSSNIYSILKVDEDADSDSDDDDLGAFDSDQDSRPLYTKTINATNLSPEEFKAFQLHSDATGKFPFESFSGNNYILVSVFLNYIHVEALPDRSASSYVKAYRATVNFFKSFGFPISMQRLDNETSTALENYFRDEANIPIQYVSANNKRANKAERSIASYKNHFISSYASASVDLPPALWDECLFQIELTLAHLRPFALNPNVSSYEGLHGKKFDFSAHPIAPVGTKILAFEPPDMRSTWSQHGVIGFYLRPSTKHYRNAHCYIPSTGGFRDVDQLAFFPEKFKVPGSSKEELLITAINDLKLSMNSSSPDALQSAVNHLNSLIISPSPSPLTPSPLLHCKNQRVDPGSII